jgi:hypothetical protein
VVHERCGARAEGRHRGATLKRTRPSSPARVPSGRVTIDEDLLLDAVWEVNEAGKRARANNVRHELGKIADDGGYLDVMVVADELAELESRGKLKRAPTFDWGGVESMPKTRIVYVVPTKQ